MQEFKLDEQTPEMGPAAERGVEQERELPLPEPLHLHQLWVELSAMFEKLPVVQVLSEALQRALTFKEEVLTRPVELDSISCCCFAGAQF
jgi:hypothetical protein